MKKINLYEYIKNFGYLDFIKKQLIYAINPVKHIKETLFKKD